MIVDGEGLVLGRLASEVAKLARSGERVEIVNAEKAVVTGSREAVLEKYSGKYERGDKDHGPHFPKRPDRILKRTVRGMLPHRRASGSDAHDRVRAYVGVPREFEGEEMHRFEDAEFTGKRFVELGEVSRFIGSNF